MPFKDCRGLQSKMQTNTCVLIFFSVALRPSACHGLFILEVYRSHTTTYHSRHDCSGGVISSSQKPLPDNTQHSQQTNIHAPGGIRTHDLSRRAAADLRLRPRGHWDRHLRVNIRNNNTIYVACIKHSIRLSPDKCTYN